MGVWHILCFAVFWVGDAGAGHCKTRCCKWWWCVGFVVLGQHDFVRRIALQLNIKTGHMILKRKGKDITASLLGSRIEKGTLVGFHNE